MADRVIQRNDTAARWQSINPILATGEIGIEIDGAKGYKIGDGKTRWNDLPYPANPTNVVQDLGNNENAVPSQKLVTEKLSELGSNVVELGSKATYITYDIEFSGGTNPQQKITDLYLKAGDSYIIRKVTENPTIMLAFVKGNAVNNIQVTSEGVLFTAQADGLLTFQINSDVQYSGKMLVYNKNERLDEINAKIDKVKSELNESISSNRESIKDVNDRISVVGLNITDCIEGEWEDTAEGRSKLSKLWVYNSNTYYVKLESYSGSSPTIGLYVDGDLSNGATLTKNGEWVKFTPNKNGLIKVFAYPSKREKANVCLNIVSEDFYNESKRFDNIYLEYSSLKYDINFIGDTSPQQLITDYWINESESFRVKRTSGNSSEILLVFVQGDAVNNHQVLTDETIFTAKASGYVVFQLNSNAVFNCQTYIYKSNERLTDKNNTAYVSIEGDDDNLGTILSPKKTIKAALKVSNNVIVRGGIYTENINFTESSGVVTIKAYQGEEVIFMNGIVVAKTQGQSEGNNVYSIATSDPNRKRLFQFGVNDVGTFIDADKRHYLEGRKTHRCDCQSLMRVNSVSELIDNSYCYSNGKIYYKTLVPISNDNYIFAPSENDFIKNASKISLRMTGINVYGSNMRIVDMNDVELKDCTCKYSKFGFTVINSCGVVLNHCEAAMIDNDMGNVFGDGFTTSRESTIVGDIDYNITSLTMIDCWGHDCWNDGYSSHYYSNVRIIGGVFDFNCIGGHGAGLTPSFGSTDIIIDAIVQDNNNAGFLYSGSGVEGNAGEYGVCQVFGLISRRNKADGIASASDKQIVELKDCVSYENSGYGFASYVSQMKAINCKASSNVKGNSFGYMSIVNLTELT